MPTSGWRIHSSAKKKLIMTLLTTISGGAVLLVGAWCLVVASGRNLSLASKEHFTNWHQKNGRTMKTLGIWGLCIGFVWLAASFMP
jgi:hypothetical protein